MDSTPPPLSPSQQHMPPADTSDSIQDGADMSNQDHLHRRTSSFSDRSPTTPRSKHRFSNASQMFDGEANEVDGGGGAGGGGTGLGNLADELDQLGHEDEEEEYEDDSAMLEPGQEVRDSGIDVSYTHADGSRSQPRKFGSQAQKPPDELDDDDDRFSPELDDLLSAIAHMSSSSEHSDADPLIPRALQRFQDLGNQTSLEAGTQRLTTSTNSLTAHLSTQSKALQTLAQSLYPVFATFAGAPLDPSEIDTTLPMLDELLKELPQPDAAALQKLQKLERETADVVTTLAGLTDTLQMGKQITNSAARHLRTTQTMVGELRREHDRAETARQELARDEGVNGWQEKVRRGWCKEQCGDIVRGFEASCADLRRRMESGVEAGA